MFVAEMSNISRRMCSLTLFMTENLIFCSIMNRLEKWILQIFYDMKFTFVKLVELAQS